LPAQFVSVKGVTIATLLPEVINLKDHSNIEDFKRESSKDNFHKAIFRLTIPISFGIQITKRE
jgi:hypothetical protein